MGGGPQKHLAERLPATCLRRADSVDPTLAEDANLELYARSLVQSGRTAERGDIFPEGRMLPDDIMGLYWRERGMIDLALASYIRLPDAHPDKGFLVGECQLQGGAAGEARHAFRRAIEAGGASNREWVGLIAAQFHAGDHPGAIKSFETFREMRLPAAAGAELQLSDAVQR